MIKFGASVNIINLEDNKESKYQLVGEVEADIEQKKISVTSPIARALIGKKKATILRCQHPRVLLLMRSNLFDLNNLFEKY